MKKQKKVVVVVMTVMLLLTAFPVNRLIGIAEDIVDQGNCGESVKWTLSSEGVLTFSGNGAVDPDSAYSIGSKSQEERNKIKTAIFEEGVTFIGDRALMGNESLTSVYLPKSLESIGAGAFGGCGNLKNVYYGGSCAEWNLMHIDRTSSVLLPGPDTPDTGPMDNYGLINAEIHYAIGHSWNDDTVMIKAACEEVIMKTYTCTLCGETKNELIPPIGHVWSDWTGLDENEHQRVCTNDPNHVETAAHKWNKGKVTTAATCETDGVKTYTCTICKTTKVETIPATGHSYGDWTELNENEHQRICANDASHIETASHKWNKGKVTTIAGCERDGVKIYICKDCIAVKSEPIPAIGHAFGEWRELNENEHQRVCANDASHVETEAHNWDEGKITKEPAPGVEGEKQYVCKDCYAVRTEPIEALPVETEAPTTEAPTTTAPTQYYTLGDVNMDGKINSADARLALRAAAKVETLSELQNLLADVDENGKLKAADARTILRISARLEPKPEKRIPAAA